MDGRRAMVVLKRAYDDVWLTGLGENFCRILDEAPGATKSIASNVGNAVGAEILTTARTVLTELTKIAVATAMGR